MEKVRQYRRLAREAREKARASKSTKTKEELLDIAREWEALARARASVLKLMATRKNGSS